MARRTFDLFAAKAGQPASCSGATQIRAGVIRPEVIIPLEHSISAQRSALSVQHSEEGGIKVGDMIRITREPYFGLIACVKALPSELQHIPTESQVRVLVATLPDGQDVTIPRANVEMIEE
jgi:transcription antitermination factor NusG